MGPNEEKPHHTSLLDFDQDDVALKPKPKPVVKIGLFRAMKIAWINLLIAILKPIGIYLIILASIAELFGNNYFFGLFFIWSMVGINIILFANSMVYYFTGLGIIGQIFKLHNRILSEELNRKTHANRR